MPNSHILPLTSSISHEPLSIGLLLTVLCTACTPLPTVCDRTAQPYRVINRFWGTLDAEYAVFAERLPEGVRSSHATVRPPGESTRR